MSSDSRTRPKPAVDLKKVDSAELARRAREGDRPAREALASRWLDWANVRIANWVGPHTPLETLDELIATAVERSLRKIDRGQDNGNPDAMFRATLCGLRSDRIKRSRKEGFIQSMWRRVKEVRLHSHPSARPERPVASTAIPPPEDMFCLELKGELDMERLKEALFDAMQALPEREREYLEMAWLDELPKLEIQRRMDLTRRQQEALEREAFANIRKLFGKDDEE